MDTGSKDTLFTVSDYNNTFILPQPVQIKFIIPCGNYTSSPPYVWYLYFVKTCTVPVFSDFYLIKEVESVLLLLRDSLNFYFSTLDYCIFFRSQDSSRRTSLCTDWWWSAPRDCPGAASAAGGRCWRLGWCRWWRSSLWTGAPSCRLWRWSAAHWAWLSPE